MALRIGAEFIQSQWPGRAIWVSDPTWGNHIRVFQAAGLTVRSYPCFNPKTRKLNIDKLLAGIEEIPDGDVLFLHTSTHNPTCIDPTPEEWERIAEVASRKGLLPFFDTAFFGFSNGIREDLRGLMAFCETVGDVLVALSFSKSFALYNDRVGALSIIGSSSESVENVYSHIRPIIRGNYSNPPLSGAAVVTEILNDPVLYLVWEDEISGIRARVQSVRERLHDGLKAQGVLRDLSYLFREKGLFTTLDLSQQEIDEIRDKYGFYIASTRRINVTSMTDEQLDSFCNVLGRYLR